MKKLRILPVLAALLLLCACGGGAATDTSGSEPVDGGHGIGIAPLAAEPAAEPDSEEPATEPEPAVSMVAASAEGPFVEIQPKHAPSYAISFELPDGWTYEVTQTEDDPTTTLSVILRPLAVENGDITVAYQKNFAVCRNCVDLKDITFNGQPAVQAMFVGNTHWDFITLNGHRGCVIINSASSWYDIYAEEIDALLSSVLFLRCE